MSSYYPLHDNVDASLLSIDIVVIHSLDKSIYMYNLTTNKITGILGDVYINSQVHLFMYVYSHNFL